MNIMKKRWIEPVTLLGSTVLLEPLSFEHLDGLSAAVKDGELWNLWYTSIPSPEKVEGYIFDRRSGKTLADSAVRVYPKTGNQKLTVSYSDIAALAFTGKDTAAGKSWEAWMQRYREKKAAGEKNIGLHPEALD